MKLERRAWVAETSETLAQRIATVTAAQSSTDVFARLQALAEENQSIHERECFNLNPATNAMNPRAEAMLATGIGSRPSLCLLYTSPSPRD